MAHNLQRPVSSPMCSFKFDDLIDLEYEFHELECERKPSRCCCEEVSWIWAYIPKKLKIINTGKWLIFINRDRVDEIWEKIKILLAANRLGFGAKVSVQDADANDFVICVYTYDCNDVHDVFRVLVALRRSRIATQSIHYKTDAATLAGVYKTVEAANRAGFNEPNLEPGRKVSMYTSPRSLVNDPTGATESIKLLQNNIGPEFKSGLIVELMKHWNDTEERISFYDPPKMLNNPGNYRPATRRTSAVHHPPKAIK